MPAFSSRISHILPPVHHGLAHLQKGIASDRGAEVFILVWDGHGPLVPQSSDHQKRSCAARLHEAFNGELGLPAVGNDGTLEPNSLSVVAPNGDRVLCPPYDLCSSLH